MGVVGHEPLVSRHPGARRWSRAVTIFAWPTRSSAAARSSPTRMPSGRRRSGMSPPREEAPVTAPTLFDVEGTSPPASRMIRTRCSPSSAGSSWRYAAHPRPHGCACSWLRSQPALLAVEMHSAGLPWDRRTHERILEETLGTRPPPGEQPERVREAAARVRAALQDPTANLDSQPKLLRSLHRVGISADSTNRWELAEYDHPAIAPLLVYKKLTRLMSANGWGWLDEWAPTVGSVPCTFPAASSPEVGIVRGGALQIPRQLRPRCAQTRAGLSSSRTWLSWNRGSWRRCPRTRPSPPRRADRTCTRASSAAVSSTRQAKIAVLGAMYGATTGDSGRLVPALRRAYPRAMGLVDAAAATGSRAAWSRPGSDGPAPAHRHWRDIQAAAALPEATESDRTRARRAARDRGRFTRNFVVQGGRVGARVARRPPWSTGGAPAGRREGCGTELGAVFEQRRTWPSSCTTRSSSIRLSCTPTPWPTPWVRPPTARRACSSDGFRSTSPSTSASRRTPPG
jgi:DNA polymerase-1